MSNTAAVARKVEAMWHDPATQGRVLAELERDGKEAHEREAVRVRLAILKLCESRDDRLAELVEAAKRDYRDVLMRARED